MVFISEQSVDVAEGEHVQFCLQHSGNLERDVDITLNIILESETIEGKLKFCQVLHYFQYFPLHSYADSEFQLSVPSFTFASMVNEVCVNITALVDGNVEDSELFLVSLISEDPAVDIENSSFVEVTVLDVSTGELFSEV